MPLVIGSPSAMPCRPGNAEVIALTQDFGYDLVSGAGAKWTCGRSIPTSRMSKNAGSRSTAARSLRRSLPGKDYFLVTAFGQFEQQPGLKKILEGYPGGRTGGWVCAVQVEIVRGQIVI